MMDKELQLGLAIFAFKIICGVIGFTILTILQNN
jgi:hypothetical protein